MLNLACLSPHPPILLPTVGSPADRAKVKKTIASLESLAPKLAAAQPEIVIISSPHPDWGVEVPLHFLLKNSNYQTPNSKQIQNSKAGYTGFLRNVKIKNYISVDELENSNFENLFGNWHSERITRSVHLGIGHCAVFPILTSLDSPKFHYDLGKKIASVLPEKRRVAWIASGDMSHRLAKNGPYGLHPSGKKFDQEFIRLLKAKDIQGILNLPERLVEEAGECGLRSFCMLLGVLEKNKTGWNPEILSYEGPFGVGYLVAKLL